MRKHTFMLVDASQTAIHAKPYSGGVFRTGVTVSLHTRFMRTPEESFYCYKNTLGCAESFNDSILQETSLRRHPFVVIGGSISDVKRALLVLSRLASAFRVKRPQRTIIRWNDAQSSALIPASGVAEECAVFWHLFTMIMKDLPAMTLLTSPAMEGFTLDRMIRAVNEDDLSKHKSSSPQTPGEQSAMAQWCFFCKDHPYTAPEFYDDTFFEKAKMNLQLADPSGNGWYHKLLAHEYPDSPISGFFSHIQSYALHLKHIKGKLTNG